MFNDNNAGYRATAVVIVEDRSAKYQPRHFTRLGLTVPFYLDYEERRLSSVGSPRLKTS
jgi:hypothetical protein